MRTVNNFWLTIFAAYAANVTISEKMDYVKKSIHFAARSIKSTETVFLASQDSNSEETNAASQFRVLLTLIASNGEEIDA